MAISKKLFEELAEQLIEAQELNWQLPDVVPVQTPQQAQGNQSGQGGQESKVIGQDEPQSGQQGQGQGQGGEPGEQGDDQQSGGAGGEPGDEEVPGADTPKGGTDVNEPGEWMDDHSKIDDSDNTGKSIVKEVYKEVESDYRKRAAKGIGTGKGGLIEKIKNFTKEDFDVSKVISRIGRFKRKLSEYYKRRESHAAAVFNPVTGQTDIVAPGKVREKKREKKSAMLIFAADTSGSITSEDYKTIFGYLQDISRKFEKEEDGVSGETFLVTWDTQVHGPLQEFKHIKNVKPGKDLSDEARERMKLKGGGGTNIQALFNWLDQQFVKEINGKPHFVFSDKMEAVSGKEPESEIKYSITQKLKEPPGEDYKEPKIGEKELQSPPGTFVLKEGGFSNVPFLIIYTDGWFSPPNISSSKLYGSNPGNILYIVTDRDGIKNVRPKNFIYHNLRADEED